jgi:NAD(P)-dependent dehydrogenase (short-subunit alcohol dehydrogenase family)
MANPTEFAVYIVTSSTCATALELANHGTVVLVGRAPKKLDEVRKAVEKTGQRAVPVVCDLSDILSVRRAAAEIVVLRLPIVGLLNNAGMLQTRATKTAQGWDTTFATNHLGPFVLTEALIPHLPDRANIVFIASGVEDPERKPAVAAGFRGGRYISAEASARGGSRVAPQCRGRTPTRRPSNASSPQRWSLPAKIHGYASTQLSQASRQPQVLGAKPTPIYAS